MGTPSDQDETCRAAGPDTGGSIVVALHTGDPAVARVWKQTAGPAGFRLETLPQLRAEDLESADVALMVVDAQRVLEADGALGEALRRHAARCVWAGPAETLDRLPPGLVGEAYDVLTTPATPAVLACRLATWARNIQRTAALESLGRRVEELAERNSRLAARLAEAEANVLTLSTQRQRLDQALQRIHQVARLSREINSLDIDRIIAVCIERLPALVEARRTSLYFYDAGADRLILQGHNQDFPIADRVDLKASPLSPMAVALRRGELLLIGEFREFERSEDLVLEREFRQQYATGSCIIVPLKGGGRVRGVLNLADKEGGGRFDEEIDLPVIEQIAELIGASIYNVELYQEMERRAKTDPLTGIANRRGVEEALARETDRARRYGSRLTAMMLDVDQLKGINDRFGHRAGDALLRNLAAIMLEAVRSVDIPGRWAGDEFIIVLPDTSGAQAAQLARRLLSRVREQPAVFSEQRLVTSLSIGVAEFQRSETLESLIHRVDQAMYAAKAAGRDGIATAEPAS